MKVYIVKFADGQRTLVLGALATKELAESLITFFVSLGEKEIAKNSFRCKTAYHIIEETVAETVDLGYITSIVAKIK